MRAVAAPFGAIINLANGTESIKYWLAHPEAGEASFDTLKDRRTIYTGDNQSWPWPVNGQFFWGGLSRPDLQMVYVGLYRSGYAAGTQECLYPPSLKDEGKACSSSMLALQSTDRGHSWTDGAGLACTGNASSFEKGSGCPDGFAVDDGGGTGGVHLLWDWNVALGDSTLPHAGLGYSHGASPTGPWTRRATPVNDAWNNTVGPYGFVKLYAGSLIKRSDDWLVVSAIGGSGWAMAAMTSKESPWGPYTQPTTVIYPQSSRYAAIIIVALGFYRVSCGDSGGG
eukprot:gene22132-15215_t